MSKLLAYIVKYLLRSLRYMLLRLSSVVEIFSFLTARTNCVSNNDASYRLLRLLLKLSLKMPCQ